MIRENLLYRYLLRHQLLNKYISNIYREASYNNNFSLSARKIIKELTTKGIKKVLYLYGFDAFKWTDTLEGIEFWSTHYLTFREEMLKYEKRPN